MKKILFRFFVPALCAACLTACTEEEPTSYSNDPAIYFNGTQVGERTESRMQDSITFSFADVGGPTYTVWLDLITQGMPSDEARTFEIRQVRETPKDRDYNTAVEGEDFVAMTDASIREHMRVEPGSASARIPVILNYSKKLAEEKVELLLEITTNDNFRPGMPNRRTFKIKFSGLPQQPSNWGLWADYFGWSWGPEKHLFIVSTCGPIKWEDALEEYMWSAMGPYYGNQCKAALEEYNLAHPDNPLREANGDRVSFYQ